MNKENLNPNDEHYSSDFQLYQDSDDSGPEDEAMSVDKPLIVPVPDSSRDFLPNSAAAAAAATSACQGPTLQLLQKPQQTPSRQAADPSHLSPKIKEFQKVAGEVCAASPGHDN